MGGGQGQVVGNGMVMLVKEKEEEESVEGYRR